MNPDLLILTLGFFYAVVFSLIAILEREGISVQLMTEVLAITVLTAGGGYLTGSRANSILFLIFLYLLTMRSRLLADIANLLSKRGRHWDAIAMLQIALRPTPVAHGMLGQRRRRSFEAAIDIGTHIDGVAGAAQQRRLDEVVAEDVAAERWTAAKPRQAASIGERADANDGVVAPIVAVATPGHFLVRLPVL